MAIKNLLQKRGIRHIIFWLALLMFSISKDLNQYTTTSFSTIFANVFVELIFQVISSYCLAYFLIPRYYLKKRYLSFVLFTALLVYLSSVLCRYITIYAAEPFIRTPPLAQESFYQILTEIRPLLISYTFPVFSMTVLFLFAKFFNDYRKEQERGLLLKKEKSEIELKTLKSQLNPHFLFNTLNNIYSLSVTGSPETPQAIGKLADMLDTILYKCDKDFVRVSDELTLLQNYLELEKLRYNDRLSVHLQQRMDVDTMVPPLILLSLVENAFKHGASEDSGSPTIWIDVYSDEETTEFSVKNTVVRQRNESLEKNIGLSNIQRQLDLLYGSDYSLKIAFLDHFFEVTLLLKNQPTHDH